MKTLLALILFSLITPAIANSTSDVEVVEFPFAGEFFDEESGLQIVIDDDSYASTNLHVGREPIFLPNRLRTVNDTRFQTKGYYWNYENGRRYCKVPVDLDIEFYEEGEIMAAEVIIPNGIIVFFGCSFTGEIVNNWELEKQE